MARAIAFNNSRDLWTETRKIRKNFQHLQIAWIMFTNTIFFVKFIISEMYHRITCMYFNFQQYRVSRSIKTVRTNIFAKNCNLQNIATTNSIFF